MNRRLFFKLAGSFVAGVALGLHCKLSNVNPRYIPNPEYENARYEIAFVFDPKNKELLTPIVYPTETEPFLYSSLFSPDARKLNEPFPLRFNYKGDYIQPFILET